ncbi:nickel pincer cofactor biosynthesis protein LarB [Streptomyces sp. NPDC056987]|uniref:nickel pincer cofactor biosynthesis protein LarB n=1 Tax=Streptomyces sp. NPDC056987 TaxID=3345988 RepID=UPI003633443C
MTRSDVTLDVTRGQRIGLGEAVLSDSKTVEQLVTVLRQADEAGLTMLFTRLRPEQFSALPAPWRQRLQYEEDSRTAFFGDPPPPERPAEIAVVTAGTSDSRIAREALRTLAFYGHAALEVHDVGVAGLWRLQRRLADIEAHRVVIAVAGMDGALPTVLAGLVPGLVIAVPADTGYGIAQRGVTALHSLLASCAPGLVVVNIGNGYGAACAALRVLSYDRPSAS